MKNKKKTSSYDVSPYASRAGIEEFSLGTMPKNGLPKDLAYQIISDELDIEGTPIQNLASFVTTWMEDEAQKLIIKTLNKNFIDHEEYPIVERIHERCVKILSKLLNVPDMDKFAGTATIGSSEAIMLGCLSHKFNWREKRKKEGKPYDKPNIIMGENVQICWDKFARYFDVEPRMIPIKEGKYIISAEDVAPLIDENTICIGVILGTTFTGEYDDIQEINDLLINVKKEKGLDIPIHVDGASGGFISMFIDQGFKWDFKLEQVKSINLSGHKYGLVYPGVGWLLFRDKDDIAKDLSFDVNYLGGNMPTYTLNFSRGSAMIVAQYYNFMRLGFKGYKTIMKNMLKVSDYIVESLTSNFDFFEILGDKRMEPVVSLRLNKNKPYDVFDISRILQSKGWIVPAYTLPKDATHIETLRIVVKENFTQTLADDFILDLKECIEYLENIKLSTRKKPKHKKAKHNSH